MNDILLISYDANERNGETGICVSRLNSDNPNGHILKMELDEDAKILYSALTQQDYKVQPAKCGEWLDVKEMVISGKAKDGREIEINIVSGKCSCCQHYAEQVNILPPIMKYSICPHCGTNMGG